jgi:DNA-binding response OmpR family regulator
VNETILVVDDEELVLDFVTTLLRIEGYKALSATSGQAGLDCFQRNQSAISLVVTDVEMPGLKGPEMARRIRELDPSVKLMFITGFCSDELPKRFTSCPVVVKPFDAARFLTTIRAYLDLQTSPAAVA